VDVSAWIESAGTVPVLAAIGVGLIVALVVLARRGRRPEPAPVRRNTAPPPARTQTSTATAAQWKPERPRVVPRPAPSAPIPSARGSGLDPDRVVDCMRRLGRVHEVGPLLQQIAEIVGADFGFERVVVRVFNPRTHIHEARAFWGLPSEEIARISNLDVNEEQYVSMTLRAARVRGGWRVSRGDHAWPDRLTHERKGNSTAAWSPDTWQQSGIDARGEGDHFVLPLPDEHDAVLGYACALPPAGSKCCEEPQLVQLQAFAHLAAAELRRARLRATLQRRELEYSIVAEQLREWQGMRDNFVANISHELRTPLTSVKAYAETLARGFGSIDQATAAEFVEVIHHEAERLEQVFDDLLDVAHLEGRGRRVARDRIDLRGLVRDLGRAWSPRFAEQDVQLRVYASEESLWIQGDADGIRQVIEALLSNALKFTPGPGTVRVYVQEDAGTAQLTVEDTGIGVPEQERLRIFERFYQVDSSATRAFGGQGLGLALCREIVGWHHGRIWVEDAPVRGSRFVATLPVRGLVVRQHADDRHADATERAQWEAFLQLTIHLVSELAGTRVASIMLVDELHDVLRIEAAVGLDEEVVQTTMIARGEAVAGAVWNEERSILVPDLDTEDRFRHLADDLTYRPRSLLSVPLYWQARTVGVLNVNTKLDGRPFDDDDRLLLEALAERIMHAFDSFERYRTGHRRLASVESGVRAMLDVGRERRTSLREVLARIGVETGRRLGLDDDHLRALSYALRTYDLGLAQISAQILRKSTPLVPEERERIEEHARLGSELVAELEPSPRVSKMILHHHENYDGSGYPSGLVGEAIPVGARIVRLADTFAALLQDRPFRDALTIEQARLMLRESVDQRFCPRVTPVFLDVVADRAPELEELLRHVTRGDLGEIELEPPAKMH
jgi:signal transduction histidine kinase/putative methionine-R-sulfoxide reductase with GAF domain